MKVILSKLWLFLAPSAPVSRQYYMWHDRLRRSILWIVGGGTIVLGCCIAYPAGGFPARSVWTLLPGFALIAAGVMGIAYDDNWADSAKRRLRDAIIVGLLMLFLIVPVMLMRT